MIEKIIEIKNIGHFVNFRSQSGQNWNGQFRKLNIIYAPNGSGKTTLSTILKSLSLNKVDLINFKKTFGTEGEPKVTLKEKDNSTLVKLEANSWTNSTLKIEVFDINYIEDYLFAGSFYRKQNKSNLYRLLLGERGVQYRLDLKPLIHEKHRLTNKLHHFHGDETVKNELEDATLKLNNLLKEFEDYSKEIYNGHISLVNKYLEKFTTYIMLKEFRSDKIKNTFEAFRIYPVFEVYDKEIVFSAPDPSGRIGNARYSLSEGDKSTIALCFFLARLELQGFSDKIIVFDDPLSSFDYSRRNTTIFQLAKIAKSSVQFFLLSHDLGFANDFKDKCSFLDYVNLKIENDGETSFIAHHDIDAEFLTATQKDLEVIKNYLIKPVTGEFEMREVIRCIRPALEGLFKTKYFDLIANNIWLGEIIEIIRNSPDESRLKKLNNIVEDLIELNDYTKSYHHATGANKNENINPIELKRYVQLLMRTIDKI